MTSGEYLVGVAVLVAMVAAATVAGRGLAARLVPDWSGPPRWLATAVLGVGVVIVVGEALGSVGLFRRLPVVVALIAVAIVLARRARVVAPQPQSQGRIAVAAAVLVMAAVVAVWGGHVVSSWRRGMLDGDTLWYHGPFAARFVQTGWVTRLHFTHHEPLVTFFPANAELVDATAILPFHRDLLLPAMNLGWLALALVAGWCIGRPRGVAPLTMVAVAAVAAVPIMAATQAGTGRNDIMALALFLAAVAIVVQRDWRPGPLAVAGVAAGLALGTKLTLIAPVAALLVAVVVAAPGRTRRVIAGPWVLTTVVLGAFWYVRNLWHTGNPLPWVSLHLGPLTLSSPPLPEADLHGSTVASHLGSFSSIFRPGLRFAFGPGWPWLVLLVAAGVVAALMLDTDRLTRSLAAVAALACAAYAVTPNGVAGAGPGSTQGLAVGSFAGNLRYATPGIALGLVLLPLALARPRRGRPVVLAALVALIALEVPVRAFPGTWEWRVTAVDIVAGVVFGIVVLAVAALPRWRVLAVALAVAALVAGLPLQRRYFARRYVAERPPIPAGRNYPWAQEVRGARIAIVGDLFQFPYYGADLSNRVQYVGRTGPHGAFASYTSCAGFLAALAHGGYQFLVAAQPVFAVSPDVTGARTWRAGAVRGAPDVLRLVRPPDLRSCPDA